MRNKVCGSFLRLMFQVVTGYVYFIQMDYIGPIKIGFTTNVQRRLNNLQTANPYKLHLLCCFPANEQMEKDLHVCFQNIRLEGEWFLPHPELLREIKEQVWINTKNGFMSPDPSQDIGDWSLASSEWDEIAQREGFNV